MPPLLARLIGLQSLPRPSLVLRLHLLRVAFRK